MPEAPEAGVSFADVIAVYRRGDPNATQAACRHLLKRQPAHVEALGLLGATYLAQGKSQDAALCFRKALTIRADHAPSNYMLGNVLRELGQLDAAKLHYRVALVSQPGLAEAWINLAVCLIEQGQTSEGIEACRKALALHPGNPLALYNLGNCLQQQRRWEEAINCYRQALQTQQIDVRLAFNMGNAQLASGQLDDAIDSYRFALKIDPQRTDALTNLGVALRRTGRLAEAIASLEQAVNLDARNAPALLTLGNACAEAGSHDTAAQYLQRAIALDPVNADAHYSLGTIMLETRQAQVALVSFMQAQQLQPTNPKILAGTMTARMMLWEVEGIDDSWCELVDAMQRNPQAVPLDCIMQLSDDPVLLRQSAERLSAAVPRPRANPRMDLAPRMDGRIKVAYISPDFGEHPVGFSIVELLSRHDPARVEVVGISLRKHPASQLTMRIQNACSEFIDASSLANRDLVQLIGDRGIDIAVDLAGHTNGGRPEVFAARPAPIQVGYLGFAHTMGAPWLDYLFVDSYVAPEPEDFAYSEKLVRLPNSFFPVDPVHLERATSDRQAEGLPGDCFVFCCFNTAERISTQVLDTWLSALAQVDNSVLWLRSTNAMAAENMRARAEQSGVDAKRLIFARRVAQREAHLARHRLADLYLDTFPYNSHSTARDALYAGLPVLTRSGRTYASRVAGSLLTTLGVPELIVGSFEDYAQRAVELAMDSRRLASLRQKVASGDRRSLLFDMTRLARDLELGYHTIQGRFLQGVPPSSVSLTGLSSCNAN